MHLDEIDLKKIKCPKGTEIEIEGYGSGSLNFEQENMLKGIAAFFDQLIGEYVCANDALMHRITVISFNPIGKQIKVRIAEIFVAP